MMIKKRLFVMILLIVAVLALFPIVSKAYSTSNWSTVNLGLNDLNIRQNDPRTGKHSFSFFCIARGYSLSENNVSFRRYADINIEGVKATNNSNQKTSSSKANAILGYIAYQASNEKIDNNTQYYNTQSQNAMWKYWKTWYNSSGKALGVNDCFDITSRPYNTTDSNNCLTKAEEYYQYLVGKKKGITINKNSAKTLTKKINDTNYYFYGPFTVTGISNSFVKDGFTIENKDGIIGIISKNNFDNNNIENKIGNSGTFGTNYYFVTNKKGSLSAEITYKVRQFNLNLSLYHNPSEWTLWQNIAKTKSIEKERRIKIKTTISVTPPEEPQPETPDIDVSIQKYIVQTGKNFNEETGIFETIDYGFNDTDSTGRKDAKYIASSNSKIYKITDNQDQMARDYIKQDNPITIEKDDYVVYKIITYNNTSNPVSSFSLMDRFDKNAELVGIYSDYDNGTYTGKYEEGHNYIKVSEANSDYNQYRLYSRFDEGIKERVRYVILKYTNNFTGISVNNAWIAGNKTKDYRKGDSDCVKMQELKSNVSLQKYITKVIRDGNSIEIKDNNDQYIRKDKKAHQLSVEEIYKNWQNNSDNYLKIDNPVSIIAGDIVQYAITVYNNSDEIDEEGIKIEDTLPEGATGYYIVGSSEDGVFKEVPSDKKIEISNITLAKGEEKTYFINVKFNNYVSNPDYNTTTDTTEQNTNNNEESNTNESSEVNTDNFIENYDDDEEDSIIEVEEPTGDTYQEDGENYETSKTEKVLINSAKVTNTLHENDTPYRTNDDDYVIMKEYRVSLEKYVSKVNNTAITGRKGNAEHRYDNDTSTNNDWKYKHIVSSVSSGNMVDYTIILRNDGDTKAYITSITDTLPNSGVDYSSFTISSVKRYNSDDVLLKNLSATVGLSNTNVKSITLTTTSDDYLLNPGDYILIEAAVRVTASNMSLDTYKNTAKITEIRDENKTLVNDTTLNDNEDSDYIQLKDIILGGYVWNEKLQEKAQTFDGIYNDNEEKRDGINVYLKRDGEEIATTRTTNGGQYTFSSSDIYKSVDLNKRYIKAAKDSSNNKWVETYFSNYEIAFEYNGVKYTHTIKGAINASDYTTNSNAAEKIGDRTAFNNGFSPIDNSKGITYTTENVSGYIPESKFTTQGAIKAYTDSFGVSGYTEDQLKNINFGLREKDIFDLELTSDVQEINLNINGQSAKYENLNKVTVRRSDVDGVNSIPGNNEGIQQSIRNSDNDYLTNIEVTYKISVTNASPTDGTATYITNYYDNKYDYVGAYANLANARSKTQELVLHNTANGSNNSYSYKTFKTPQANLSQGKSMDIYVVYKLKDTTTLKNLENDKVMPTYNMAEIYEYTTKVGSGQTEFTRGLIDKDSAPGSVASETARLSEGTTTDNTVQYYFKAQSLSKLKYEDDTYATPTLYYVSDSSQRKLTGYVFEDYAPVDPDTKIKSGNGMYKDEKDNPVYGATVILTVPGSKETYTATSNEDGYYEIAGFIPGEGATLTYQYGNKIETVLIGKNEKSYNGEDFQATNNKNLNINGDYWYIANEKKGKEGAISIAKDSTSRRSTVSENVANSDELMVLLNRAKAGKTDIDVNRIIDNTWMQASTDKAFTLTVEKATGVDNNGGVITNHSFGDNTISNMNFGIAEVPVTTIELKNNVTKFKITDAAGDNVIAEATKENGQWKIIGNTNVIENNKIVTQIEEQKLQGAKLEITYTIDTNEDRQINFDGTSNNKPVVKSLISFVDNNLTYNSASGDNSKYWKVITINDVKEKYNGEVGTVINKDIDDGKIKEENKDMAYTTILQSNDYPTEPMTLTLEKTLSSHDVTLENIVESTGTDSFEYSSPIEIFDLDYTGVSKDRVRTPETDNVETSNMIISVANAHDYAAPETTSIIPPLGENNNIQYYVIAASSIAILALGVILIKKFAIKKD